MSRWGMVIDLEKCIGCDTCTVVCQQMNHVPGATYWHQVLDFDAPSVSYTSELHLPIHCMHCEDAPCLDVCPTTATFRRDNGIIDIHDDLCIGCAYCIVACPYIARTISSYDHPYLFPDAPSENNWRGMPKDDRTGICTKCDFCLPRVEAGLEKGLTPGVDIEATPGCVSFCIGNALHFGDLSNPESNVSQMIQSKPTARLQERQNTGSAIHYVLHEEMVGYDGEYEVVKPRKQHVWEWPAVANFVFGGMGAGLYILGVIFGMLGVTIRSSFEWLSPLIMVVGLSILAIEAGRPFRARFLYKHLQRSWMSREAVAAGLFVLFSLSGVAFSLDSLKIVALICALFFMISQGFILYRSVGIGAWNTKVVPFIFAATGFASGFGLITFFIQDISNVALTLGTGLLLGTLSLILWLTYIFLPKEDFEPTAKALRRPKNLILSVGVGHILPLFLFVLGLVLPESNSSLMLMLTYLAAVLLIIGMAMVKWQMIITGGYFRALKLGQPQMSQKVQPQPSPQFIPLTTINP